MGAHPKGRNPRPPAKVVRPSTRGTVARERLFQRLDGARSDPVTWICAPPGSGKTTLLSSYVESRELPCLWYQVDAGDRDPASFFHYLGAAARVTLPRKRSPLPSLTPERLGGLREFARDYFTELFGRLAARQVLVFDDYQELPEEAVLHGLLVECLTRLPRGVRILVASRSDPPPPFARLRGNRRLQVVGWEEVRLTLEEFRDVARAQGAPEASSEALQDHHARLDGWAAGLTLLPDPGGVSKLDTAFGDAPDELFDYFAAEVFARLDAKTRDLLLKTSFLPAVTPAAAEELAGETGAARILSHLHRQHCFTERRGSSPLLYRYHSLFREFLTARAREELAPAERQRIQRAAARHLAQEARFEVAAELLQDAGDHAGLADLVRDAAPALVRQGRGHLVASWIDGLPDEEVRGSPWLLYWAGASRMGPDPRAARGWFERSFRRFLDADGERAGLLLAWSGAMDAVLAGLDDFAEADPWVASFYETVGGPDAVPADEAGSRAVASMYAALVLRCPDHPEFDGWEARALGAARASRDPDLVLQILSHAAFSKSSQAHFAEAEMILDRMRHAVRPSEASPLGRIRTAFVEGFLHAAQGLWDRAFEQVEKGLGEAESSGVHAMDPVLLTVGARAALNAGDLGRARDLLGRAETFLPTAGTWHGCLHHYFRGALALREGNLGRAAENAGAALGLADAVGIPYGRAAVDLLVAEVAQARGDRSAALEAVGRAARGAEAARSASLVQGCRLVEAGIRFAEGEDEAALEALRDGMAFGARRGDLVPYLYRPADLAALCARALAEGIEAEYVTRLIRKCHLTPEAPPLEVERWPWPLRVYTLGRFELVRDGEPVRARGKAQQKPLELLKALIAFGGRRVGLGPLAEALWPDADGDLAQQSLATTLHRLRKLLGVDGVLSVQEGRLSLDTRRCWVDVWAFERLAGQAEKLWKQGSSPQNRDGSVRLSERACALYQGRFLPQETGDHWVLPLRERLRSKFVRLVEDLGRHAERTGRWDEAVNCYRRAVEVDPLVEEFYRRLMAAFVERGQRAEALAVYRRCHRILGKLLGLEPSPETEALRRGLS